MFLHRNVVKLIFYVISDGFDFSGPFYCGMQCRYDHNFTLWNLLCGIIVTICYSMAYFMEFVHTKDDRTLLIHWSKEISSSKEQSKQIERDGSLSNAICFQSWNWLGGIECINPDFPCFFSLRSDLFVFCRDFWERPVNWRSIMRNTLSFDVTILMFFPEFDQKYLLTISKIKDLSEEMSIPLLLQ